MMKWYLSSLLVFMAVMCSLADDGSHNGLLIHNAFRKKHHVSPLLWNDEMAAKAERMATEMATKGTLDIALVKSVSQYGENVARISDSSSSNCDDAFEEAVKLWYNQGKSYSFAAPSLDSDTDTFTQVVWKDVSELGMGCSMNPNKNEVYVVALYNPPGNIPSQLRANVLDPSEKSSDDLYANIAKRFQTVLQKKRN